MTIRGRDFKIIERRQISDINFALTIQAPDIARKAQAGQFVIIRIADGGERIPLTLADWDSKAGTILLIVQKVGRTTRELSELKVGDTILDIVGPLGLPIEVKKYPGSVLCVGGGVGIAPLYPKAKALKAAGNHVISILGARSTDLLMLEDEMQAVSDQVIVMTDDGSKGTKGLVTAAIQEILDKDTASVSLVIAIGPPVMMKFVSQLTHKYEVKTEVSLNPIMVDGTGMCGGCRVRLGNEIKFACVDGPVFDGHLIDWDELIERLGAYKNKEKIAADHVCRLGN